MSRFPKLFLLMAALGASGAYADEAAAPAAGPARDTDTWYFGAGAFSDMPNVNVEAVTPWGQFMVRVGRFADVKDPAANMSWRVPLEGDSSASDFYIGVFAGHVAGEGLTRDGELRLGGGAEMGYHWVTDYTRTEVTVGLGAAEKMEIGPTKLETEPTIFFSVNMALGY